MANIKKDDIIPELENHFILRMPAHASDKLRHLVHVGNTSVKDKISIELYGDNRHGTVRFDKEAFAAKLVDMPSILESYKTIDKKTFFKTADICQMLVCTTNEGGEDSSSGRDEKPSPHKNPNKVDKKFLWNHGITPPLKNVRKRRFRKTAKKKYIESPDIEKEVKRLLRMDSTAIKIRWEMLPDKDGKEDTKNESQMDGNDWKQIFEEVSSSENEEEEEDVNIMELEDSRQDMEEFKGQNVTSTLESLEAIVSQDETLTEDSMLQENEFVKRYAELEQQMTELNQKKRMQEEAIANVDNVMLKQRFQSKLDEVLLEMKKHEEEMETLKVLIGPS
ncbi:transcription initiation factor TFIID subunit 7-like [Antedon mediterranea]|uniref:transcription initiation factor TFIID subunit 7-like n=1 Tax=Antedon mediterranea TaxID=105859 RepID=UPI003AF938F5